MQEKVKIIDGDNLNKISDASTLKLVDTLRKMNAYLNIHSECLVKVVDIMCKIKENEDLFKIIREKYLKTDTSRNQPLINQNNFETFLLLLFPISLIYSAPLLFNFSFISNNTFSIEDDNFF